MLELANCGCCMYKDKATQGGFVLLFDGFLWDMGESKAKRMTASMAKETVVQNMTLGSILHQRDWSWGLNLVSIKITLILQLVR